MRGKALKVLKKVEQRQGPSSETCGLIGRIHKDYWSEAVNSGNDFEATGHLNNASNEVMSATGHPLSTDAHPES